MQATGEFDRVIRRPEAVTVADRVSVGWPTTVSLATSARHRPTVVTTTAAAADYYYYYASDDDKLRGNQVWSVIVLIRLLNAFNAYYLQ